MTNICHSCYGIKLCWISASYGNLRSCIGSEELTWSGWVQNKTFMEHYRFVSIRNYNF